MEETRKPVTPLGDFNCQDFPLIKGNVYEISDEELEKLGKHELKWSTEEYQVTEDILDDEGNLTGQRQFTKTRPILIPNAPTEENRKREATLRIAELKRLLADSDYQAIKYAEGLISASDYIPIKAKREMWRKEINDLEKTL